MPDGSRKITNICEISGMEGSVITTQDLFVYERQGYDEKGRVKGVFRPLGIRPKFTEKLESHGIKFDPDMFFKEPSVRGGR